MEFFFSTLKYVKKGSLSFQCVSTSQTTSQNPVRYEIEGNSTYRGETSKVAEGLSLPSLGVSYKSAVSFEPSVGRNLLQSLFCFCHKIQFVVCRSELFSFSFFHLLSAPKNTFSSFFSSALIFFRFKPTDHFGNRKIHHHHGNCLK